jgi:hypothetical protein
MTDSQDLYRRLRETLIECFQASGQRDRLIREAKLDPGERPAQGTVRDIWDAALQDGIRTGKLDGLLALAIAELPANGDLKAAVAAWRALSSDEQAAAAPRPTVSPARSRADFYAHISLPPNYVPRPELLAEVRQALLADPGAHALTSGVRIDALHGMGGMGKSVLARALCDEPELQAAYPDGILWAAIGQTPDLVARLSDWIRALGGVIGETAPTPDRLKANLAGLLRDRACLLILDDVWRKEHVEPFRTGGPGCRLLLTTRDAALVEDLGGRVHPIPLMAGSEAVTLLELWAGEGLQSATQETKDRIVERLGRLPLAIKLAGAQLQRKDPESWLATFDARRLESRRPEQAHDSLAATFGLSLDDLSPADRSAYAALAIFKEDEPVPATAAVQLWTGLDGRPADDGCALLDDLAARALVQGSGRGGAAGETVVIHDLLRDFMAAELGPDRLLASHRGLLDAYRATQQGNGWHTAPDDGYLYDHLAYHLGEVARLDPAAPPELSDLFATRDWLDARVARCARESDRYLYDGYLADLAAAWERAHAAAGQQIDAGAEPSAFDACVRYALIRTSTNSLADAYEPALVARAVEIGLWPARRALSVAGRVPDAEQRASLYTKLLSLPGLAQAEREEAAQRGLAAAQAILDEENRARALGALAPQLTGIAREQALAQGLAAAQAIEDEESRAQGLAALAPQLTDVAREQALAQGLAAAQAIEKERHRAGALAALAPHLTGELLAQGLAAAQAIEDEESRAHALAALAPHLTGELLAQGLAAAQAIEDEESRAHALAALAPHLTGELLAQGLAAAQAIEDEGSRAHALAALAPQLSGAAREQALAEGLAAAQAIRERWPRAQALTALALQLSGAAREQALAEGLAAAQAIRERWPRAQALVALAPELTGDLLAQGLAAVQAIEKERHRAGALAALAPHLTGELLAQGLAAAQAILDEGLRAHALAALAPRLTGELLDQGLAVARAIRPAGRRTEALAALAPHLTGELLAQGLAVALAIRDAEYQAQALAALAPRLADIARQQALAEGLAAAQAIADEWPRAEALAALAPQLAGELLAQGLAAAQAIGEEGCRAEALAALAPQLRGDLLAQGLAAVQAIEDEGYRAQALAALAPQLSGDLLAQGLAAAQTIADEWGRVEALAALAPQLTGSKHAAALTEGLAATQAIAAERGRVDALAALAPQLTGSERAAALTQGLAVAQAIGDERGRVEALAALAPQLTGSERGAALAQGLAAAQAIEYEPSRVYALAALAPHLTGDLLAQGLAAAQAIGDEGRRAEALAALAPQLSGELLAQALAAARAIGDEWSRAEALAALAPYLTGDLLAQALAAAQAIGDEGRRAEALTALAPRLAGAAREQAFAQGLAAARALGDEGRQARALAAFVREDEQMSPAIPHIRRAMVDHFHRNLAQLSRSDLLDFCADKDLFRPPILSPTTLAAIAHHIIDICGWEWL